jgi:hypothetical protein
LHPDKTLEIGCLDPDCRTTLRGGRCLGNHLEVNDLSDEELQDERQRSLQQNVPICTHNTRISCITVHGKNERTSVGCNLKLQLPPGDFTDLLLVHIRVGHSILQLESCNPSPYLFNSDKGQNMAERNCDFTAAWGKIMKRCPVAKAMAIPYFPPSKARTSFVQGYRGGMGVDPKMWDGAAACMGNSVRQWDATYDKRKRGRMAQEAVNQHQQWVGLAG